MIWPPSGRRAVAWSPNTDRLLYVRGSLGNPHLLYVINADGSGHNKVTTEAQIWDPTWSAEGDEIYFIGDDDDLYVINADGSNRRRLSGQSPDQFEGVNTQSWSPDRSQIAVVYNGLWESIYLMDADGSNERLLVGFEDHSIDFLLDVAWSADGSSLLLWGHQGGGPHSKGSVIFRVDSNGSNLRQLTTRQDDDHFDIAAKWSPDGSKISFLSNRDQGCSAEVMVKYSHCDQYESYVMNADGSETARVDGDIRGDLHWSLNGQQFAFNVPDGDECCLIYVADRDGTNQRSLGKRGTIMGWLDDRVLTPATTRVSVSTATEQKLSSRPR
jgi:Tol biopolymer transport system component